MIKRYIIPLVVLVIVATTLLWATSTVYTEPWTSTLDGWTFTQLTCTGTCVDGLITTDGNPADAVSNKETGRSKAETGYWKLAAAWTALGVPSGDTINTVDGQWDDKTVCTAIACTSSTTVGIQIFDSANTTECSATNIEPPLNVAGDTAAWTTHNPTGAVTINQASCQPAGNTVTLRLNSNPASGNNASAAAEIRLDNFKLTIVSTAPPKYSPGMPLRGVGMVRVTEIPLRGVK